MEYEDYEPYDLGYEDDAYALASAGWGTEEDYGHYVADEDFWGE